MTDAEFRVWLDEEVREKLMSPEQRKDLLEQKDNFDRALPAGDGPLRGDNRGRIVGYVAGEQIVAGTIHALLDEAKRRHADRMVYFEPIGFDLY